MYELSESEMNLVHGGTGIDLTALFTTAANFMTGLGTLLVKAGPLVTAAAGLFGALATFFAP